MEQCRSLAFGWKHSKDYTCRAATETRRAGNTGDPRSGRVAARGGGCATGACRHRANHRGPRFHAGKSKGRPHLKRCIHQRERLLLRATGAFFMRSGKLYFLSSSTGTVPTSRPPSSTTATFRSAPVGASRDQPCDGLRVGNGLLVITAIETGGIDKPVAVLHVEKIPRHIQDRLLLLLRARPQLFVAAEGWESPMDAIRLDFLCASGFSPTCQSAWGPDTDQRAKLLICQAMEGSILDAYLQTAL